MISHPTSKTLRRRASSASQRGVADETASPGAPARFGATETQTVSVLRAIEGTLADLDLAMGDVFRMQVFLVAPADDEGMDFDGFMAGYTQFFGTEDHRAGTTEGCRSRRTPERSR